MARSGESSTIAPSRWERNVTQRSSILRSSDSDMTWKPPESVRIGSGQFMNLCKPPERRDALGAGPQHQVIGVGEHDVGAGRAHGLRRQAFHAGLRSDRHEGRRCDGAVRGGDLAAARRAVRGYETKGEIHQASCVMPTTLNTAWYSPDRQPTCSPIASSVCRILVS